MQIKSAISRSVPAPGGVVIRPATPGDIAAISTILRELGWFDHINREAPADTEARIARHLDLCLTQGGHTVLVAESRGGEVIGYTSVHWQPYLILSGPEGYVSELFVRRSHRGGGVGRMLMEAVKEQAVSRGCSRLMLLNGRGRESYRREFYKKTGWAERPEIANFILPLAGTEPVY